MALVETRIELRPYEDRDQSEVLELLDASLGGGPVGSRPAEFFRWKHIQSPFGRSYMLVAQSSGRIVGLRAFMRWRFTAGDTTLRAVRAVDTATHPDHQGKGIFSQLTRRALEDLRLDTDLVFNTPNEKSLPGYLKMGWQIVDRVPIYVHVRRPVRFARHAVAWKREIPGSATLKSIAGIDANQVLADPAVDDLLRSRVRPEGLSTPRDIRYLRWRYGDAPLLDYRAIVEHSEGSLDGIAFFRVRPRGALVEATVSELITRARSRGTARRLLARVARESSADHVTCSFPRGSAEMAAARREAFLRTPGGMTFVVNPLGHSAHPDPLEKGSWALSVGDVEVF